MRGREKLTAIVDRNRDILQSLEVSADQPGTLIQDMEHLLDYLKRNPLPATGQYHFFPTDKFFELNDLLSHNVPFKGKRPKQEHFPHLHGLFLLMRVTGLIRLSATKKRLLEVNSEVETSWRAMNMESRYASLLDAWMVRGFNCILEKTPWMQGQWSDLPINAWSRVIRLIPKVKYVGDQPTPAQVEDAGRCIVSRCGRHVLGLLHLFGFLDLGFKVAQIDGPWDLSRISATPLGNAMFELLGTYLEESDEVAYSIVESEAPLGTLRPLLQMVFPKWDRLLDEPNAVFRDGVYQFKVSSGRVWRLLSLAADSTLQGLAEMIIDSFELEGDHLHLFELRSSRGRLMSFCRPEMDDYPRTIDIRLGELPIGVYDTFDFVFDLSYNNRFKIVLEAIKPKNRDNQSPRVLQSKGSLPLPNYD